MTDPETIAALRHALATVLACRDPRCVLCVRCLAAVSPTRVVVPEPPIVTEDDFVRAYQRTLAPAETPPPWPRGRRWRRETPRSK